VGLGGSRLNHPDLQQPRISRDEADVQSLEALKEDSWVNPFRSDQDSLIHLVTAAVAPRDIVCDLMNAQKIGEELYQTFKRDRLSLQTEMCTTGLSLSVKWLALHLHVSVADL